ncbi:serine hydrolase domain-containing protein [Agrobacterium vitis]
MRLLIRFVQGLLLAVLVVIVGAATWLWLAPPELLRVGTGYAAKIVCSNVFIAKRDPMDVLSEDVQAPGHPLLRFLRLDVDRDAGMVTAYMFGAFAPSTAIARPGLGCANVPDGKIDAARKVHLPQPLAASATPNPAPNPAPWPDGTGAPHTDPVLAGILADPALTGPSMRATLVIRDGELLGEAYGPGFGPDTPLIGWSMTKTVMAMLIGQRMGEGGLDLDKDHLLPQWTDGRAAITLRQLMGMESGLRFNEDYGDVSDATRMLFLEPDQAAFVASQPLDATPGTLFHYSTGTSVLLARLLMNSLPPEQALSYPQTSLFKPLGMTSAVLEADETGTLAGGSYLYANARDWAKLAQCLLQDGVWQGRRLLPEGYVKTMATPTKSSGGTYGQGQIWRSGPGREPDSTFGINEETLWFQGHDGQTIAIVPSRKLIVLRMGLTPAWDNYRPQKLLKAVLDAMP